MENTIFERQNTEQNIVKLAAIQNLYSKVGYIDIAMIIFTVILPCIFSIVKQICGNIQWLLTLSYSVSLSMLVLSFILPSFGKRKKELAASIQQEFDIDVYQMPWDSVIFGDRKNLNHEIAAESQRLMKNDDQKEKMKNWYSSEIKSLTLLEAIKECQTENYDWDMRLRKRYVYINRVVLFLLIAIPVVISLIKRQMVIDLMAMYILLLPAFKWFIGRIHSLEKDITTMETISKTLFSFDSKDMKELQIIQNAIYQYRKENIKIPSWLYRLTRNSDENRERQAIRLR